MQMQTAERSRRGAVVTALLIVSVGLAPFAEALPPGRELSITGPTFVSQAGTWPFAGRFTAEPGVGIPAMRVDIYLDGVRQTYTYGITGTSGHWGPLGVAFPQPGIHAVRVVAADNLLVETWSVPFQVSVAVPPGPPLAVTTETIRFDRIRVGWDPPLDDGGGPVTSYRVLRDGVEIGVSSTTSFVDDDPWPGRTYSYSARATNVAGTGPASVGASGTGGAPVEVTRVTGRVTGFRVCQGNCITVAPGGSIEAEPDLPFTVETEMAGTLKAGTAPVVDVWARGDVTATVYNYNCPLNCEIEHWDVGWKDRTDTAGEWVARAPPISMFTHPDTCRIQQFNFHAGYYDIIGGDGSAILGYCPEGASW